MVKKDYYRILQVPPTSTLEDIKKAYRILSKRYHPDLNPDMRVYSDEKMKELVEAYSALSNPDKRAEYDNQPHFQIRKSRKSTRHMTKADVAAYTQKPTYQKESSLLERVFSSFLKPSHQKQTIMKEDPKQADVHFTLGLSMAENPAFFEQAAKEFHLACKFQSNFPEALYNLGVMQYKAGNFEEALIAFQKVLAVEKNDNLAYTMINLLREEF